MFSGSISMLLLSLELLLIKWAALAALTATGFLEEIGILLIFKLPYKFWFPIIVFIWLIINLSKTLIRLSKVAPMELLDYLSYWGLCFLESRFTVDIGDLIIVGFCFGDVGIKWAKSFESYPCKGDFLAGVALTVYLILSWATNGALFPPSSRLRLLETKFLFSAFELGPSLSFVGFSKEALY